MKYQIAAALSVICATGCLFEPEKKVTVIDCGTINLPPVEPPYWDEPRPPRDTFEVKDGKCGRPE